MDLTKNEELKARIRKYEYINNVVDRHGDELSNQMLIYRLEDDAHDHAYDLIQNLNMYIKMAIYTDFKWVGNYNPPKIKYNFNEIDIDDGVYHILFFINKYLDDDFLKKYNGKAPEEFEGNVLQKDIIDDFKLLFELKMHINDG